MNNASLRTYIYKGLILGLVPVITVVNFQSISVADPVKTSKPTTLAQAQSNKIKTAATPVKANKPKAPAKNTGHRTQTVSILPPSYFRCCYAPPIEESLTVPKSNVKYSSG